MKKEEVGTTKALPPIREGKDVKENEPKITIGKRVASIPPPTITTEA